jgi:5-deoxy-D-glucuronate isomerase
MPWLRLSNGKSLEPKQDNPEPVKMVKEGKREVKEEEEVRVECGERTRRKSRGNAARLCLG